MKSSGHARYAPWLCAQLPAAEAPHRQELLRAIGVLGTAAEADVLLPYLFYPDTYRVAGWAIRRLDG